MKFQELDPEKKFRIRHKVVEYSYGAFDALLAIAEKEEVDVIDLWRIFDAEMYENKNYYKAPEMVATSTEAKEIIPENNSSTTPETNPDPAKLIEEAVKKKTHPLTEEQVAEIRRLRIEGKSAAYLANKYGVTLTTIYNKLSTAPKNEKEAWINKNTTPVEEYVPGV